MLCGIRVASRQRRTGDCVDNVDGGSNIFHRLLSVASSQNSPLVARSTCEFWHGSTPGNTPGRLTQSASEGNPGPRFALPVCVINVAGPKGVTHAGTRLNHARILTNEPTAVPFTIVVSCFETRDFVVDLAVFEKSNEPTGRLVAVDGGRYSVRDSRRVVRGDGVHRGENATNEANSPRQAKTDVPASLARSCRLANVSGVPTCRRSQRRGGLGPSACVAPSSRHGGLGLDDLADLGIH